ncbi:hypothetical protein [Labrenzia sp. OB1]|uniref:hypothetical protein n=1 Tax=Labrenzia sp. OB1 TaxID=1561204 RepID=UPI0018FE54B8|nr:hypothetical protein [Labrenzia sp. OB1]
MGVSLQSGFWSGSAPRTATTTTGAATASTAAAAASSTASTAATAAAASAATISAAVAVVGIARRRIVDWIDSAGTGLLLGLATRKHKHGQSRE